MKRYFGFLLTLCILLSLTSCVFAGGLGLVQIAQPEPISLTIVDRWKGDHTIELGMTASELCSMFGVSASSGRMPYWADPETNSPEDAGYRIRPSSFSLELDDGQSIRDLELYCAYDFSDEDSGSNQENAKLYMIEYELYSFSFSESDFDELVSKYTQKYGTPSFTEYTTSGLLIYNGVRTTSTTYHRSYLWERIDNTGIRLSGSYEAHRGYYDDVMVRMGRTDLDPSLLAGKSVKAPSFMQATVNSYSVVLRDENNSYKQEIDYGTLLLITGYNAELDMFSVKFTEGKSGIDYSGGGISMYSTIYGVEGYIYGNGLSVSRDRLLSHFR